MIEKEKAMSSFRWLESQRLVFVGCFLIGTIGVISIRLLTDSVLAAILFAAMAMFTYVLVGASKKYVIRPDIIGDNSYYLGFLFTLVSLAFTLYKYTSATGTDQIDTIIQNFGLALSTTLIGLVLRVYFNQTNEDPEVFQKAIRMSLAEEASKLIGETAKIRNDVSILRTSIQQSIDESINASFEAFSNQLGESSVRYFKIMEAQSVELTNNLKSVIGGLNSSVSTLEQSVSFSATSIAQAVSGFGATTAEIIEELRSLSAKARNIRSLDEVVHQKIAEPIAKVESGMTRLADVVSALDRSIVVMHSNLDGFSKSVGRFSNDDMQSLAAKANVLESELGTLKEIVETSRPTVQRTVDALTTVMNDVKDISEGVQAQKHSLETSITESQVQLNALKREAEIASRRLAEGNTNNA